MTNTYAVFGVASGIGASIAELLNARGDRVVGFDLRNATGNVDLLISLDLNGPVSSSEAAKHVDEHLDGRCNNAGLPPRAGLEEQTLQVNFLRQRAFTHAITTELRPGSAIVNVASRAGAAWRHNVAQFMRLATLGTSKDLTEFVAEAALDAPRCYSLSKEVVIFWTQAMTEDLIARELRANSVSPGAVATNNLDDFARAIGEKIVKNENCAGRHGTPQETAKIVI